MPTLRSLSVFVLAFGLLAFAPPAAEPLRLHFRPTFGGQPLVLEKQTYTTRLQEKVVVTAFRFYVSAVAVEFTDGTRYQEPDSYHLLDAEEPETLTFDLQAAPAKPIRRLTFCVGVDSAASTGGALGGALDPSKGMYWAWQSGYINAKLEGRSPASPDPRHGFEFHIGGYQAPHRTLRAVALPIGEVRSAGRELVVVADAGQWLADTRVAATPSIVQPGAAAARMADAVGQMFRLE